jgi:hypothetical protein
VRRAVSSLQVAFESGHGGANLDVMGARSISEQAGGGFIERGTSAPSRIVTPNRGSPHRTHPGPGPALGVHRGMR